jgi:5-methylcytosine-specific restriction endonuclease McrA
MPNICKHRRRLFNAGRGRCCYCGRLLDLSEATVEHRTPKALGGRGGDNLAIACRDCQGERGRWLDVLRLLFGKPLARQIWPDMDAVLYRRLWRIWRWVRSDLRRELRAARVGRAAIRP